MGIRQFFRKKSEVRSIAAYDAFISHSHADKPTAFWLKTILEGYWVPGHKRRNIFFDTHSIVAGPLSENLRRGLQQSRHLVLCLSQEAVESTWVNEELDIFLQSDTLSPKKRILLCRVGKKGSPNDEVQAFITSLEAQLGYKQLDLYVPDLTYDEDEDFSNVKKQKQAEALSLLAPLLGLKSKEELLSKRKKFWIISVITVICLSLIMSGLFSAYLWYLSTPRGHFDTALADVKAAAKDETLDEYIYDLIPAARALGKLERKTAVRDIAQYLNPEGFRYIFLAEASISLPEPDCQAAGAELNHRLPSVGSLDMKTYLRAGRICGNYEWIDVYKTEDIETGYDVQRITEMLVITGNVDVAETFLENHLDKASPEGIFLIKLSLALSKTEPLTIDLIAFDAWRESVFRESDLYTSLELLRRIDSEGRLTEPELNLVWETVIEKALIDLEQYQRWDQMQEIAARLAGAGKYDVAKEFILQTEASLTYSLPHPDYADEWAWRALALFRLGELIPALEAFAMAEECALTSTPQSRTLSEWDTLVSAYALTGDWVGAFEAADLPPSRLKQTLLKLKVMALYAGVPEL